MTINRSNPDSLPAFVGVSHVVEAGGFIHITGQVGLNESGEVLDDVEEQIAQVYANLEIACRAAGASLTDMVKTVTYVTDPSALPAIRAARLKCYGENPPANSTIMVAGLTTPKAVAEIEGIAYLA